MIELEEVFPGDSAMSAAMRRHDWASTPLGPPRLWPEALKLPLRMMLTSRFEMWLGWGPDLLFFYNDAYLPTLGVKHPHALGQPIRVVWAEIFGDVEDRINSVMRDGIATWDKALLLILSRNSYPEETYHTFSYSPLHGKGSAVAGLMCIVTEETERVLGERRLDTLRDLATSLLPARSVEEIVDGAGVALAKNQKDFPFSVIRLFDHSATNADRSAAGNTPWPFERLKDGTRHVLVALDGLLVDPPRGAWDRPPRDAMIVPITKAGHAAPSGALVLGLNPYRPKDAEIAGFAQLVATQIAGALATLDAHLAEAAEMDRLRELFEQSPTFMAVLRGPEHRFELVNPSYSQLVAHRDVLGKAVREALPEVNDQGFFELLDRVYDSGEPFVGRSAPIMIQRTPGAAPEPRFLDFVYQPIRNNDGIVAGIFVEGIDVTAAHETMLALRESETQFRTFAQAMPNQVWTSTPAGQLDWFNDQTLTYSGLDHDALAGDGWIKIVHPEDLSRAGAAWSRALATGGDYEVEFRIRGAAGAYRWHIVRALPIRDSTGHVLRWIGTNTDIHERKLAEAETARDRDRIWTLSQELMLVCDLAGTIVAANPSVTRVLGWREDELVGRTVVAFTHPADIAAAQRELAKLGRGQPTNAFESRHAAKDGRYRLIDWTTVMDGDRVHRAGRDITDERAATQEWERSWTLSPVLKVVGTLAGDVLAVNPSWTNVLGWSESETVGRNIMEFVAPEDRAVGISGMRLLAEGAPIEEFRNVFATKAGGRRCISWTTVPEDGTLYAFGRDVTTELEAAAALAATTADRERIWNSMTDLMATAGSDGHLKSVNPAWKRLLGYDAADLTAMPFIELVDPTDRPAFDQSLKRLANGVAIRDLETRLVHKDGRRSLLSWSAEPIGASFYIVGRDVTDQRAAEDALRQSQKMEAVGQLTGGIAHDFNNLLQGIIGSLDLLQIRASQGRYAEFDRFITGAMTSANRAAALTHRLLAFSRRQPLDPRPVRANPLVASMEDLLRRSLGERIQLELVLAGGLWLTTCDPNQLENAVLNLAINARDAMPGGGKLTIETCNAHLDNAYAARLRDVRPGQYVCVSVTDSGIGMDADTISRAFEPFFTTKPIGQGTGLGLSMIYGFARQSEGHARIYSELGKGTTVKLYLPRYRGDDPEDNATPESATVQPVPAGETVLVVEDEAVVRGLIVEVLNDLGYRALEASDGPTGLEWLQSRHRIDLLITDVGLPGLNGRQLADAGRTLRPDLRVLFMTGYAENAAFASGFLEPGMTMITKPFAIEALAARVRDIIEDR